MRKNPKYLNNIQLNINIVAISELFIILSQEAIKLQIFIKKSLLQREIGFLKMGTKKGETFKMA